MATPITERKTRLQNANELIKTIAGCGRKFFKYANGISHFELDQRWRIWFVNAWNGKRIYLHYRYWRCPEGGTLRDLINALKRYIQHGEKIPRHHLGPFPEWYSDGDPWGYGHDMEQVRNKALELGIIAIPEATK